MIFCDRNKFGDQKTDKNTLSSTIFNNYQERLTDGLGNFRALCDDRQTENAATASTDLALTADLLSLGH